MESKIQILLDLISNKRYFILGYHSVIDDPSDVWAISPRDFAAQMEILAQKRICIISLDSCVEQLRQGKAPGNAVVITFDDGYLNFLQNAVPVLQKHQFPATLFVPANQIGQNSAWCKPELQRKLMGWSDLQEVIRLGYSVGSHSLNHVELTTLNPSELTQEVFESKNILEDHLGNLITSFACPFSVCSEREAKEIERAGYSCGCGPGVKYGNGLRTNRFMLGRAFVKNTDSTHDFINQINGFSFILNKIQKSLFK